MTNATGHGPDHAGHDHDHAGHGDDQEHGHGHGHGHGHDDEHGQVGGIRRRFGHGHGHGHGHHDAAVTDDLAMTTAAGIRASIIGLIGLLATALVQLALVGLTGSVALLSDTGQCAGAAAEIDGVIAGTSTAEGGQAGVDAVATAESHQSGESVVAPRVRHDTVPVRSMARRLMP